MPLSRFNPERYDDILAEKASTIRALFDGLTLPEPAIFQSPDSHFRMRAEFRLWHEDDELFYVMFDSADKRKKVRVDQFPIASKAINELMPRVIDALKAVPILKDRCFQVEFISTLSGEMLVTMIYHIPLSEQWQEAAAALQTQLGCKIIGRSRKQKVVLSEEYVTESLNADSKTFQYLQYEGSFTQPNALVNQKMISWACARAAELGDSSGDLLELYCGNGNFTLPLASYFPKVLATEISKVSIRALEQNCELNNIDNIAVARMSAEEASSALKGVREYRRLAHVNLSEYDLKTLFVDPPRAGLDDFTRSLAEEYQNIIYISCNPTTLARDLRHLSATHNIVNFAFFDQFPYTDHMECGAILTRC